MEDAYKDKIVQLSAYQKESELLSDAISVRAKEIMEVLDLFPYGNNGTSIDDIDAQDSYVVVECHDLFYDCPEWTNVRLNAEWFDMSDEELLEVKAQRLEDERKKKEEEERIETQEELKRAENTVVNLQAKIARLRDKVKT